VIVHGRPRFQSLLRLALSIMWRRMQPQLLAVFQLQATFFTTRSNSS
jgi:hypothetical protein